MRIFADLHSHTNNSDGTLSIEELINVFKSNNIKMFSITDHDTLKGLRKINNTFNMEFIPGVEFSCEYKNKQVHILGYMKKFENVEEFLKLREEDRKERAKKILQKLKTYNIYINFNELINKTKESFAIGRPHIARLMLENGYVKSVKEAFDKYISDDGPCFVKKMFFSIEKTVKQIHNAQGFAVLAHPSESKIVQYIDEIKKFDIDGIEVYTPKNNSSIISYLKDYCIRNKLIITGGSDYHGDYEYTPFGLDKKNYEIFLQAWEAL